MNKYELALVVSAKVEDEVRDADASHLVVRVLINRIATVSYLFHRGACY